MAHIKYMYFAKICHAQGDVETAKVFEETAAQEVQHAAVREMDEQIEESKEHAARFSQMLAKAAKRFAALAKVEERHANHYKATLANIRS